MLTIPFALIPGASSGISAATAKALVREGARVILLAHTQSTLDYVATYIRSAGGNSWRNGNAKQMTNDQ